MMAYTAPPVAELTKNQIITQVVVGDQEYWTIQEVARFLNCRLDFALRKSVAFGWRMREDGPVTRYSAEDVMTYVTTQRCIPTGYLSTEQVQKVLRVTRSSVYTIAKQNDWCRFTTDSHTVFYREEDVQAYLGARSPRTRTKAPLPEKPVVVCSAPEDYWSPGEIASCYGHSKGMVYQIANRLAWKKLVQRSRKVYYWKVDVLAYYEPEGVESYSLEEAAAFHGISLAQCALAARLSGWRKLRGLDRYIVEDVTRPGTLDTITNLIDDVTAAERLALTVSRLSMIAADRKVRTVFVPRISTNKVFYDRGDIEFLANEVLPRRRQDCYTVEDVRNMLGVSRQRVNQLATRFAWKIVPGITPRPLLYRKSDVDAYILARKRVDP